MPLDDRSGVLRSRVLTPSGGWLGEGVILISDLLGLWDIFVLMALFVVFWVFLRVMSCEVSILLGLVFDLGIPLQYNNDKSQKANHKKHLQKYWPMFSIGTIVEAVGFFHFHPDLFTLVVCIKTCVCLGYWLSRRADGSKVSLKGINSDPDRDSSSTLTSTRPTSTKPTSTKPTSTKPTSTKPTSNQADATDSIDRDLEEAMKKVPKPVDTRFPDADARLKDVGYSRDCRDGMIFHLKGEPREKQAKNNLHGWLTRHVDDDKTMRQRESKYAGRNRKERMARAKEALGRHGATDGSLSTSASGRKRKVTKLGKEARTQIQKRVMHRSIEGCPDGKWSDILTREKYLDSILAIRDPEQLRKELEWWELYTQSGARLNLAKKIPHDEVERCRKMLVDHMGMDEHLIYMADKMIEDMMDQPTVEKAQNMMKEWRRIARLHQVDEEAHGKGVRKWYQRYNGKVHEPYPYRTKPFSCDRLERRWDQ